eukprot:TRINITY_DN36581_c0_g1_i1.p1 TRINITY_DN36581_c0_g1~~TRINITY_DN36581_c0_g1_i1.p1  ORF type:complete len:398 (+),score=69.15 TRINITY_DN36581_c0_g1_i1:56-1195(+)
MVNTRYKNSDHLVRMPTPVHGCTSVAKRAAAALQRHRAFPRPPTREATPARPVQIRMGALNIATGDEVTKTCIWKKEAEMALAAVQNDVVKLDEVVNSEKDRVFTKRGELILGASSNSEQLRTILSETIRPPGNYGSSSSRQRQKTKFDTFIVEQLEKLSSLHPLGYAGLVLRQLELTNARAILDVESKALFHDLEVTVSRHLENDTTLKDDQSTDADSDVPEDDLDFSTRVDQAVQCDMKEKPSEMTSGHLSGGKATARVHLAAMHNIAVQYHSIVSEALKSGATPSHEAITEDETIVKWVHGCNNILQQLGVDLPKVSLVSHINELKSYLLTTATSQTNLAITQSLLGYLTQTITSLLDFLRELVIKGLPDIKARQT